MRWLSIFSSWVSTSSSPQSLPISTTSGLSPVETDPLVLVLAENHRLAVFEIKDIVRLHALSVAYSKTASLKILQF